MKRISPLLAAIAMMTAGSLSAATKTQALIETPASDSRIEYTGRTQTCGGDVSYDWSGVYVRVRFQGPYLAMKCSDSKNSWFNLWVDKEMSPCSDRKFSVAARDTLIVLAEGLSKGTHEIILQKRTEGEQGRFTIHSFLSRGEVLQAAGRKTRHIEFIGDSYTCGYGTESQSASDPFEARTENCNLTYAAILARYFNADFNLSSHSGQGICRNYDDFRPGYNIPDRYRQTFDEEKDILWDAAKAPYKPDIVVVYACTNDFSTARQPHETIFAGRYIELLRQIKANYGEDIPILCVASNVTPFSFDYIRNACMAGGLRNVSYIGLTTNVHRHDDSELGASGHPNYKGHIKVACSMAAYISTLTGWEMEAKAFE